MGGFDLTALVVISTDCKGSCKPNDHTIKTTTAHLKFKIMTMNSELVKILPTKFYIKLQTIILLWTCNKIIQNSPP